MAIDKYNNKKEGKSSLALSSNESAMRLVCLSPRPDSLFIAPEVDLGLM